MTDIQKFLSGHALLANDIDADALVAEFLTEMKMGLSGQASSLAMIPTYISVDREIPIKEPVIVVDAGGTNLRVALISFDIENRACIDNYVSYSMPGSQSEVSAKEFFAQLAEHIKPMVSRSNRIGFCFSYPAEISPEMDGKLLKWTKEMKAPEVIGRFIGKGLIDALGTAGIGKKVVLLNDTVATLLAGKSSGRDSYGSYVGFILGTGTNIAYLEKNKNILKVGHTDLPGSQAINVESGAFRKAPRGDFDILLDQESEDTGGNQFEKMISGRYLPKIALMALQKGAQEGLFDKFCGLWIQSLKQLGHDEMDDLFHNGGASILKSVNLSESDRDRIRAIVSAVIERAAKFAAINVTAAVVKAVGGSIDRPVCINIDGTTYYKVAGLRERIEKYLREMLGGRNIEYVLTHVERAPMIGAAVAGLVN